MRAPLTTPDARNEVAPGPAVGPAPAGTSGRGRWLLHPWLTVRVQIALGAIFVGAALPKIVDPPAFAHMVYNYKLVPGGLVNLMALTMPWLELLVGVGLILGIWRRTSAIVTGALLVTFIVAISINLARAHPVNCGCFDVSASSKTRSELLREMKVVVVRDLGMLLMVGQILAASAHLRRTPGAATAEDAFESAR